jgi:4'-phosphopantetheinyl transferase
MEDGIEVVLARLTPDPDADRESMNLLSDDERRRAEGFVLERDRHRCMARRALLRRLLGKRLGVSPASIQLACRPGGKPVLSPPLDRSGLRFSVSHCQDLVLYSLSRGVEVGVDIEAIGVTAEADRIASTTFSALEYATYRRLRPRDKPLAFLLWWTRKEALLKATGDGLSLPLHKFDVSVSPSERTCTVDDEQRPREWRVRSFFPARGFVAAIAHEAHS